MVNHCRYVASVESMRCKHSSGELPSSSPTTAYACGEGAWPAGQAPFGAWLPMKLLDYATGANQQQKKS